MADKANVNPRPTGEAPELEGDKDTARPSVSRPNEPGIDRERDPQTEEPKVEPVDEVSEGR